MIRTIIVEDDPVHSERLKKLLNTLNVTIKVLSICTNINDAIKDIENFKPELIFLDIDLECGESGFDIIERTSSIDFDIIFTTMHSDSNYVIAAIRACALDYLVKPLNKNELENAINRFKENKKSKIELVKTLKANLDFKNYDETSITISDRSGLTIIGIRNIIYCESDNEVTTFYLEKEVGNKLKYVSSRSIGEWEKILKDPPMVRVHNQYIINFNYIIGYTKGDNFSLKMKNGINLPVSKAKKDFLIKRLKSI